MRPEWIARHEKENYTLGRGSLPFSRALALCVRFGSGRRGLSSHIDNLKNRYYDIVVLKAHLGSFIRKPILSMSARQKRRFEAKFKSTAYNFHVSFCAYAVY